jgi:hypothetical protein
MNLSTIAMTLGVEDFTLCEVCDAMTSECLACACEGDVGECANCHDEYGCE